MTKDLPVHLGFIVDGNRRWARAKNLPTLEGHRRGFKQVEMVAEKIINLGVKYASFYLFSTENWNRSKEEVSYLMDLLRSQIQRLVNKLKKKDIRILFLGTEKNAPEDIIDKLHDAEMATQDCKRGTVCVCFNYGGQQEIADAANAAAKQGEVTVESINNNLYHPAVPPCDMIVRTSGEERISGFMLWRAAYSEFLFLDKNFPDITGEDLPMILENYAHRQRRFGH